MAGLTLFRQRMRMIHGDGGELARYFLVEHDGATVGRVAVYTSSHDNLDLAWLELASTPPTGAGGSAPPPWTWRATLIGEMGRTKVGWFGWEGERTRGFAAARGSEPKSVAVCRRQHVRELEPGLADRAVRRGTAARRRVRAAAGRPAGCRTTCCTRSSRPPPRSTTRPATTWSTRTRSSPPTATASSRSASLASEYRIYRILARHLASGEIAGVTSVIVDGETSEHAHQLDTSVVGAHRGHRLGLLLKADMLRWLTGSEPRLAMSTPSTPSPTTTWSRSTSGWGTA